MENNTYNIIILQEETPIRLDVILTQKIPMLSRAYIHKLMLAGKVEDAKGNIITNKSYIIKKEARYKIIDDLKQPITLSAWDFPLKIIWEDEYLAIVNKPAGLVVHPGAGNRENTMVNALIHKYNNNLSQDDIRPGVVHRLDKDTSGILVIAKNNYIHEQLGKQFAEHSINREYRALCWGVPLKPSGTIESYITRSVHDRKKMMASKVKGKKAKTKYKVLNTYKGVLSLINLTLYTGRTHQIRVHLTSIGNSILGDNIYGKIHYKKLASLSNTTQESIKNLNRFCLHAYKLGFQHPITKKYMEFVVNEPDELRKIYNSL